MQTSAECGGIQYGTNDQFQSPNYPENYNINDICEWLIVGNNGTKILLVLVDFQTEKDYDYIFITDGLGAESPLLLKYSGTTSSLIVSSSSPNMYVRFSSDYVYNYRGFNATWQTIN